jgi:hypothetical protein
MIKLCILVLFTTDATEVFAASRWPACSRSAEFAAIKQSKLIALDEPRYA